MKDYLVDNDQEIDLDKLKSDLMPLASYKGAHEKLVISCHDVFINYKGGILLVKRDNLPVKNEFWSIGGRVKRGLLTEDSLREKVKEECGLELEEIQFLGSCRTYFATDPFGHGHGTDTLNVIYYAKGKREINLDNLHSDSIIVTPEMYTSEFKNKLHPYVRDYMDLAMKMLK